MSKAKDKNCCIKGCKSKAVAFWPVVDPDIPSNPYCRKHLDESKIRLLLMIQKIDISKNKKHETRKR